MLSIYSKTTTSFNNLGIGVLRDFKSEPLITEVLNGLYNLEFEYACDGWLSEYLVEENIIKANGQPFRIWNVKKNVSKTTITILAKHIFFDAEKNVWLEDVSPTNLTAQAALTWCLNRAKDSTPYTASGDCTNVSSARYVRTNLIDAVYNNDNAILKNFGGEIELNNYNVIIHNKRGEETGIEIRQKKNLTGADYELDFSQVATRIMPIGNDGLLLPERYIDSPIINNYFSPLYYKHECNIGIDEESGITEEIACQMMRDEVNKLFLNGIDKPVINIKIDFIELSKTTEYIQYSSLETAHLGDSCKVYIPSLNLSLTTRIVKTVYNCLKKRIVSLELGSVKPNIATSRIKEDRTVKNALSVDTDTSILQKAKEQATSMINHPFAGYLYIDETTGQLYIMDTTDPSTAQKVWKWGLGGLGFSSTGINGTYGIAITQDGSIVADYITTGQINTNLIQGYNDLLITVAKHSDELSSLISKTIKSTNYVTLENAYKGPLYELSISGQMSLMYPQSDSLYGSSLVPTNTLVPSETLVPSVSVPYGNEVNYPSSGIYPKNSVLLIDNKEYVLDLNFLNYLNEETYDEFLYHDGKCKIIRRVGIDSNGDKYALDNEFIEYRDDIDLEVNETSTIKLKLFNNMTYNVTYLQKNEYTDVFASKVELNSSITQTAEQITLEVNKKVDENEIISKINQSAEQIQIDANKISLDGKEIDLTAGDITINSNHFNVDSEGNVECNGIQITDGTIQLSDESSSFGTEFSIESSDPNNVNSAKLKLWGNSIHVESTVNSDDYANFGLHMGSPALELSSNNGNTYSYLGVGELYLKNDYALGDVQVTSSGVFISNNNTSKIKLQGSNGNITCVSLTQTSREDSKKNFEKYTGALKEILNTDIYKYNLKDEKDTDKKHLGLVIGKKYNYSKEIISIDEKGKEIGVDNYSMTSLCLQAIKEQQEIIESLKERIEKLEESDK